MSNEHPDAAERPPQRAAASDPTEPVAPGSIPPPPVVPGGAPHATSLPGGHAAYAWHPATGAPLTVPSHRRTVPFWLWVIIGVAAVALVTGGVLAVNLFLNRANNSALPPAPVSSSEHSAEQADTADEDALDSPVASAVKPSGKAPTGSVPIGESSGLTGAEHIRAADTSTFVGEEGTRGSLSSDTYDCDVYSYGVPGQYDGDPSEETLLAINGESPTERFAVTGADGRSYEFWGTGDLYGDDGVEMYRVEPDGTLTSLFFACYDDGEGQAVTLPQVLKEVVLK